jgi:hypothetical protein
MRMRRLMMTTCCVALLAACSAVEDGGGTPGPTPPPGAADASLVALDALPDEVAAALADASERFGVPEAEVAVAGALRVTWSDGALGCPEEGVMYTQALVPGYLLTLEVEGRRYSYHGAEGQDPFLCER